MKQTAKTNGKNSMVWPLSDRDKGFSMSSPAETVTGDLAAVKAGDESWEIATAPLEASSGKDARGLRPQSLRLKKKYENP